MKMADHLHIAGRLTIRKYTTDGSLVEKKTVANDITTAGRLLVARLFNKDEKPDATRRVSKIHLGTSQDSFNADQKALLAKIGETDITRIAASEVSVSNVPRVMLRLAGELGEQACNGQLREAGLFTADGVMYNRVTFDTITKSDQFKLTLVWEITF
jgi:hypothetical protein